MLIACRIKPVHSFCIRTETLPTHPPIVAKTLIIGTLYPCTLLGVQGHKHNDRGCCKEIGEAWEELQFCCKVHEWVEPENKTSYVCVALKPVPNYEVGDGERR